MPEALYTYCLDAIFVAISMAELKSAPSSCTALSTPAFSSLMIFQPSRLTYIVMNRDESFIIYLMKRNERV